MNQKIEWYREVLELEPGSRVFFPLAKLLAADGQASEAVRALRQGLLRHPDHVEARLLLVELLSLQNADGDLKAEVEQLETLLAAYPGFWKAWSERLASRPSQGDAALAMRFFAAVLQGQKIGWGDVIAHGVKSLLGANHEAGSFVPSFAAHRPSAQEEAALRRSFLQTPALPVEQKTAEPRAAPSPLSEKTADAPRQAVTAVQPDGPALSRAAKDDDGGTEDEEADEAFSIRTRSMAEVLAEQGDITGALDIYHELMQSAGPDEKQSLLARADELARHISAGSSAAEEPVEEKNRTAGGDSTRLVSLLESLAQRLEARAN